MQALESAVLAINESATERYVAVAQSLRDSIFQNKLSSEALSSAHLLLAYIANETGNYPALFTHLREYNRLGIFNGSVRGMGDEQLAKLTLLVMRNVSQTTLNQQFVLFMQRVYFDPLKKEEMNLNPFVLTHSMQQFFYLLKSLEKGMCEGYASKWIYGKILSDESLVQAGRSRDDAEQFTSTLYKVATADMSTLSIEDKHKIDYFLSTLIFFQMPQEYVEFGQGQLEEILEESKMEVRPKAESRKILQQEYQVSGTFTCSQLITILGEVCKPGRGLLVHSHNHATAIYFEKKGTKFQYYDSNSAHGEETISDRAEIAKRIFESNSLKPGISLPIALHVFSRIGTSPETYPAQAELLKSIEATIEDNADYADGFNALHKAVDDSDLASLEYFLKQSNADVALGKQTNLDTNAGHTPLLIAAVKKDVRPLQRLLDDGHSDLQALDKKGRGLLHLACIKGNEAAIEILLDLKEVDPNQAIQKASTKKLFTLLGEVDFNLQGATPLHLAVLSKRLGAVAKMLDNKRVDPARVTADGSTVLHVAARAGDPDMMRFLLSTGKFDLFQKDNDGFTCLENLAQYGDVCLLHVIWEHSEKNRTLFNEGVLQRAIKYNQVAVIHWLASKKMIDFNKKMENGKTPLEYAVSLSAKKSFSALSKLEEVDLDAVDEVGNTLLMRTILRSSPSNAVVMLEEKSLQAHHVNKIGQSAMDCLFLAVPRYVKEFSDMAHYYIHDVFEKLLEKSQSGVKRLADKLHVALQGVGVECEKYCLQTLFAHPDFDPAETLENGEPVWFLAARFNDHGMWNSLLKNPRFAYQGMMSLKGKECSALMAMKNRSFVEDSRLFSLVLYNGANLCEAEAKSIRSSAESRSSNDFFVFC